MIWNKYACILFDCNARKTNYICFLCTLFALCRHRHRSLYTWGILCVCIFIWWKSREKCVVGNVIVCKCVCVYLLADAHCLLREMCSYSDLALHISFNIWTAYVDGRRISNECREIMSFFRFFSSLAPLMYLAYHLWGSVTRIRLFLTAKVDLSADCGVARGLPTQKLAKYLHVSELYVQYKAAYAVAILISKTFWVAINYVLTAIFIFCVLSLFFLIEVLNRFHTDESQGISFS